jgi:hypothetical protein
MVGSRLLRALDRNSNIDRQRQTIVGLAKRGQLLD